MYLWLIFFSLFLVFPILMGLFRRIRNLIKGPDFNTDYHEEIYRKQFRRMIIEVIIQLLVLVIICLCWAVLFLEPFKN